MKKISKKIIPHNNISNFLTLKNLKELNFFLVSANNIIELNKDLNIWVYKKGLYRYFLPGKFNLPIKSYFKNHTYIDFVFTQDLISSLIINKNIILFNYKNFVFMNNSNILRFIQKNIMFESLSNIFLFKRLFLIALYNVS
jgi:hypothetical protein